ncbi:uncharacterized protein LOC135074094 isoform X2 [Ostrinia nubilalis]|uniref:uncharacterized protein LOC135074094 isoform X2 n=1 Tax=Ostrinia nubilalis TaxID=29057 RepID=UPI00308232B6
MFTGILLFFISLHSISQLNGAHVHGPDDKIFFPGPIKEAVPLNRYGSSNNEVSKGDVPDECKNKNYCTVKPPDYPQKKFDSLIKHRPSLANMIRQKRSAEEVSTTTGSTIPLNTPVLDGLEDKQGDPDEVDNCETIIEFEPLYKVKSETGGWRTVVQSPEKNFVQLVRLETCKAASSPCFTVFPKLPTYTTFCKQKYTTWHFVVDVESGEANKTETIPVDLPTCCSCFYRSV